MIGILGGLNWEDGSSFLNTLGADGTDGQAEIVLDGVAVSHDTARTSGPKLFCWSSPTVTVALYADSDSSSDLESDAVNPAQRVAEKYAASPESLNKVFGSAYSLVLIDNADRKVFLSVDLFARFPLYFLQDSEGFRFSTSSIALTQNTGAKINPQSVFNYLYFHMVPTPNSIYQKVEAVESSHFIEITQQARSNQLIPGSSEMRTVKATGNDSQRLRDRLAGSVEKKISGL